MTVKKINVKTEASALMLSMDIHASVQRDTGEIPLEELLGMIFLPLCLNCH